ncbi:MAG: hypothetical protein KKE30_11170 [Gammaproteobacteria bacterium]|nr:hypothetical protein [Gammaproteobacteria bacterium]MBU1553964.1 hypothetical protein [Gammaproteobacteria bacterium]MBU2069531.1 hypothetical protein [Gammaproteobacteria bacterium]MBU2183077.1 hypothetical protein [Gammaproteobacteria bacterium]MBU2203095.1 hypothetical protein [Gammaproteobacteria bacterium]
MYKFLLIFFILTFSASSYSNPLQRFSYESIASSKMLAAKLGNSEWIYTWRGRDYKLRFNDDGSIGLLNSWTGVNWYVTGNREVVLEAEGSKMLLNFNANISAFYTRDWDGEKSVGRVLLK